VDDCCPEVDPTDELVVVWRVRFTLENIVDGFVEDGDGT
jgi:hypothetical protein